jgi:Uncharacterised nucleotidyltransferase
LSQIAVPTDPRSTRPEVELLLACARTALDAEAEQRIRNLLHGGLDWEYIVQLARRHRVTPLLYSTFHTNFPDAVPAATMQLLREDYRAGAQQSLRLTSELLKLLALFEAHGIPALPLKGPTLAAIAYGNLSLRQFDDLDILIREADLLRAKDIFIAQGYQAELDLAGTREAAFLRSQYEYHFERDDGEVLVGLHYHIRPRYFSFALAPEILWERRKAVQVAGKQIWSMSLEDHILTLCVHGTHHYWGRLAWLCDIAELIRHHHDIQWSQLLERAAGLGNQRALLLGLSLANDLLGAAVPEQIVLCATTDQVVRHLARDVCDRLARVEDDPLGLIKGSRFHLRAIERQKDKLRYCMLLALLPTAEDWALVRLPAPLTFIYSLIRPFRLVGTYGAGLLHLVPAWRKG